MFARNQARARCRSDVVMALGRQEIQERVNRAFAREDALEACRQRDIGALVTILGRHGISQGVTAGLTGISQGRLSEYANGRRAEGGAGRKDRVPTLDTIEKFADGLGIPEPARRALRLTPASRAEAALTSGTPVSSDLSADALIMPDLLTIAWMAGSLNSHVDRRTVMQLASTLAAAPLLGVEEPVEEPAERLAHALMAPASLQDDTVTFLEQRTGGLVQIEQMFPARILHRSVMSHLREVTALLEGHPDDPLRQRLAKIAGESAALAACTAWDLGEGAHSARMYRVTETAARVAVDPVIMACAYADRSGVTSGPAAHEDARRLLARARACLPSKGEDATRAYVLGREAEEAAALGDKAAEDLLRQAAEAFARARPQRERPWARFLDQTRMSALELSAYTRLGDEQKVHELTDDLLATVVPASKRAVLVYADLGIAAVRLGDVSNGISYGRRSLEAVGAFEASWELRRLEELARALAQEPKARELRAEIRQARHALASPR